MVLLWILLKLIHAHNGMNGNKHNNRNFNPIKSILLNFDNDFSMSVCVYGWWWFFWHALKMIVFDCISACWMTVFYMIVLCWFGLESKAKERDRETRRKATCIKLCVHEWEKEIRVSASSGFSYTKLPIGSSGLFFSSFIFIFQLFRFVRFLSCKSQARNSKTKFSV